MTASRSPSAFLFRFAAVAVASVLLAGASYWLSRTAWNRPPAEPGPKDVVEISEAEPEANPGEANPGEAETVAPVRAVGDLPNAIVVMQEGSGEVNLTPATAILSGRVKLQPTGGDEQLELWSEPGDQAAWAFRLLRPGFFHLEVTYAATDEAGEAALAILIDDEEVKTYSLPPTGDLEAAGTQRHTVAIREGGRHTLAVRLGGIVAPGSLILERLRLLPAGSSEATR